MLKKVVSKYFLNESGMDNSLSDFQEKKKYNIGPKNLKNTRKNKKSKRTKGQNDIRTLIKKQENDVLQYSEDFDKVCKEAGVDVDSEELQLAIALSKSLHEVKKENSSDIQIKSTGQLTSQQRTLKIKRTLQEYGFRIPITKITDTNKRKRYKKKYKLLHISERERQQIISDKYSEVLARNILKSPDQVLEYDYSNKELYYKTTNIPYGHLKNDDVYYIKDLFEKSIHKNCLLRNWSEIPGRPLSPTVKVKEINFDDIVCDQYELDCILSGTIFATQQIVNDKSTNIVHDNTIHKVDQFGLNVSKPFENKIECLDLTKENITFNEIDCHSKFNNMSKVRCVSPDLFDDEVSVVFECPNTDVLLSRPTISQSDNIYTFCMDLTDCVNTNSSISDLPDKKKLCSNNEINATKRRSNDLMEITECVSSSFNKKKIENIDLNKSIHSINIKHGNIDVLDLTGVPDYNPLPEGICCAKKDNSLDNTIILIDDDHLKLPLQRQNLNLEGLTEPICIDDLNNDESKSGNQKREKQSFSTTFKDIFNNSYNKDNYTNHIINIDFDEHANEPVKSDVNPTSLGKRDNISIDYDEINQNIESVSITSKSDESHTCESNFIEKKVNNSSNYISFNPMNSNKLVESNYLLHQSKHNNIEFACATIIDDENSTLKKDASNSNSDITSEPSKSSEVFNVSDKEFNYSINQSNHENWNFKDASVMVMNDFSNYGYHSTTETESSRCSATTHTSQSNLQRQNINSPLKETASENKHITNLSQTPKNGEYIIKTTEVTPMQDYASMSTPERYKELEKYGLKPFKRKRAIQLLTYLYNQTHPIVESQDYDCPSPPKRLKRDNGVEECYVKNAYKSQPIRQISEVSVKSIDSTIESNKENNLYDVTSKEPDVRNIECDAEDWFFQKREKAKFHSCRVPLHVAFHNYVSSRRRLREAILRYEPVNIDIIHKDLVASGYKYNAKDLLKFMDRKCITVKTADNNSRNRKS